MIIVKCNLSFVSTKHYSTFKAFFSSCPDSALSALQPGTEEQTISKCTNKHIVLYLCDISTFIQYTYTCEQLYFFPCVCLIVCNFVTKPKI